MPHFLAVLFSTDYLPNIGGVATHVHELGRALQASGVAVQVITVRGGTWRQPCTWLSRDFHQDDLPVFEVSLASLPGGLGDCWRFRTEVRRKLQKLARRHGELLYHCHDYDGWGHALVGRHAFVGTVFTNHTSMFLQAIDCNKDCSAWREKALNFDHIIAPSRELAEKTIGLGVDARRVTFVPNGVDAARFRPDGEMRTKVRNELGIPPSSIMILCARRITPKNGVIDFAHALRFLKASKQEIWIVFAGNSDGAPDAYERETRGAISCSGFQERSRYLGHVPNADMPRYYAAADISVLPSLKEAVSIAGLEAMACGVPLVGTRVGGIPDLITDERDGLIVEPGDPRSFASALDRLIASPDMRRSLGETALKTVREGFTWKRIAELTKECYARAIETRCKAQPRAGAVVDA